MMALKNFRLKVSKWSRCGCCCCFFFSGIMKSILSCLRACLRVISLNPMTQCLRYFITIINTVFFYLSISDIESRVVIFDYIDYWYINIMFLFFLAVDVFFRILAQGCYKSKNSFLRSSVWNAFDLCLVISGWALIWLIELGPFRILVFVGLLKHIPVLSLLTMMINSAWRSLFRMKGMIILIVITLLIFAMMGVDFFKGDLGKKCVVDELSNTTHRVEAFPEIWCSTLTSSGLIGTACPANMTCLDGHPNLYGGVASFDHYGSSLLSTFQIITLSGWAIYYQALSGASGTLLTTMWMMPLVFVVAFLMMNLIITAMEITFALTNLEHAERVESSNSPTKMFFRLLFEFPKAIYYRLNFCAKVRCFGNLCLRDDDIPICCRQFECCGVIYGCFSDIFKFFVSAKCYRRVERSWMILFETTSMIFIMFYVMSVTVYQMGGLQDSDDFLVVVKSFCYVFLAELVIRILIYGIRFPFNVLNLMDLFVIPLACIEFTIELGDEDNSLGDLQFVLLMRMFRVIELFKFLFISKNFMRKLIISIPPTIVLMVFSFIVTYFFAQAGTQIFRETFTGPRNFNNMQFSMRTLFVIFSGDNWEDNMYEALGNTGSSTYTQWVSKIAAIPYFVIYFIITNYLLMNFFIVIVMHSFDIASEEDDRFFVSILEALRKIYLKIWCWGGSGDDNQGNIILPIDVFSPRKGDDEDTSSEEEEEEEKTSILEDMFDIGVIEEHGLEEPNMGPVSKQVMEEEVKMDFSSKVTKMIKSCCRCCCSWTMCPGRTINQLCRSIVNNGLYNMVMILFTLLSTMMLIWEEPAQAYKDTITIEWSIFFVDYLLLTFFFTDFALKIMSLGPMYFFDVFNLFDFITLLELISSIILVNLFGNDLTYTMYYIRRIRLLRPIRLINHLPDIKIYMTAIYRSVLSFVNIIGLYLVTMFVFALIGTFLFATDLTRCNDTTITYDPSTQTFEEYGGSCVGTYYNTEHEILTPRALVRINSYQGDNFDHTGHSFFALFTVSTLSDWSTLMFHIETSQTSTSMVSTVNLYFCLYVAIVGFFVVNLVVGVIMDKITDVRGMDDLTDPQLAWMELKRFIHEVKPLIPRRKTPKNCCLKFLMCCGNNTIGKKITIFLFLINCVAICVQWSDQPIEWTWTIEGLTLFFIFCYLLEDIVTAFAIGCYRLIHNTPILIEFALVALLLVGLPIIPLVGLPLSLMRLYMKCFSRIILLLRIYRYAFHSRFIQKLATGFRLAVPSILNAGFLLVVIIFCFACIGRSAFGNVRYQTIYREGWNFRSWKDSILLLIRILTLDDWNGIIHELSIRPPFCTIQDGYNDCSGSPVTSYIFFVSYIVLASSIILNLFIAIILDNFQHLCKKDNFVIQRRDIRVFLDVWKRFDPKARGRIKMSQFPELCHELAREDHMLGLDMHIGLALRGLKRGDGTGSWDGRLMMSETQFWLSCLELWEGLRYTKQEKKVYQKLKRFNVKEHLKELMKRVLTLSCCLYYCCSYLPLRIYEKVSEEERRRIRRRRKGEGEDEDIPKEEEEGDEDEEEHPLDPGSKKKVKLREVLLTLSRFHVPSFCKTEEEKEQRLEWFKFAYTRLPDFRTDVLMMEEKLVKKSFNQSFKSFSIKKNYHHEEEEELVLEDVVEEKGEKEQKEALEEVEEALEEEKKKKMYVKVGETIVKIDQIIRSPQRLHHSLREKVEGSIRSKLNGIPVVKNIVHFDVDDYEEYADSSSGDSVEEEEKVVVGNRIQEEEVEIVEKEKNDLLGALGIGNLNLKESIKNIAKSARRNKDEDDGVLVSPSESGGLVLKRK